MKVWILFLIICFAAGFMPQTATQRMQRWLTVGLAVVVSMAYFLFNQI